MFFLQIVCHKDNVFFLINISRFMNFLYRMSGIASLYF